MHENDITGIIVNAGFHIHKSLGPGLFESIYEKILAHELIKSGLSVQRQLAIPVIWDSILMEKGFRADLIVESKVLIEIKSIEAFAPVHIKQVLTYLKLTDLHIGLLLNFNENLFKNGIRRIINK